MRCRKTRKYLSAFLDGELEEDVRQEIKRHIEGCAECMEEYRSLVETVSLVRGLPRLKAPEGLWTRIKAELAAENARRSWQLKPIRRLALMALSSIIVIGTVLCLISLQPLFNKAEETTVNLYVQEHLAFQPLSPLFPIGSVSPVGIKAGFNLDYELQTLITCHYEGE